jgi:uncharacterized protein YjbJ (UPF0337 family)
MNEDQIKGKAKEAAGKVTGDDRLEREGQTDQAKGKVKDVADDVTESVAGVRDSLRSDDDADRR